MLVNPVIDSFIYVLVWVIAFVLAIVIMQLVFPFSFRKEIEQDQNVALGIMIAWMFIALGIIIHAAIAG